MSKGVRTIFVTLVGTMLLIVVLSLFTEIINISLSGIQLQQNVRMACEKSLTLFAQESYKQRTDGFNLTAAGTNAIGGSINMADIVNADGTNYISGEFYNGSTVPEIYRDLYDKAYNPDFATWADDPEIRGNWQSVDLINQYLNGSFPITTMPDFNTYVSSYADLNDAYDAYEADVDEYTNYLIAKSYVDTYMTPLNFGVPYIDVPTANKMFQWNVTQLLSNYSPELIVADEYGEYCVQVDGFRIYTQRAAISNIEYQVYDLNDASERSEFIEITHVNPSGLGFETDTAVIEELMGTTSDERTRICIIGVNYTVPVSYIGITPIRNIFNWVWTNEVEGYNNMYSGFTQGNQTFHTNTSDLTGGGIHGNAGTATAGVLPVPGKLIFYLVR